jgi:hypothetical protein
MHEAIISLYHAGFDPMLDLYIMRQALLQQEVDYLLEVSTSGQYGYIPVGLIEQSRTRLARFGLNPQLLVYDAQSTLGHAVIAAAHVPRGEGIALHISYPMENLFAIDSLIGVEAPDKQYISAYGVQMSEYVAW